MSLCQKLKSFKVYFGNTSEKTKYDKILFKELLCKNQKCFEFLKCNRTNLPFSYWCMRKMRTRGATRSHSRTRPFSPCLVSSVATRTERSEVLFLCMLKARSMGLGGGAGKDCWRKQNIGIRVDVCSVWGGA